MVMMMTRRKRNQTPNIGNHSGSLDLMRSIVKVGCTFNLIRRSVNRIRLYQIYFTAVPAFLCSVCATCELIRTE